ncbi:MAG: WD40 repeat domain-containing protein [Planctomycetaceae bacterium]
MCCQSSRPGAAPVTTRTIVSGRPCSRPVRGDDGGGSSGGVLEAGDPDASYLWSLVTHESEPKMPPESNKLPEDELAVIKNWIVGGLLENSGSTAMVSNKPKLAKIEIKPGERPAEVAMPAGYLGDPKLVPDRANGVTALTVSPWAPLGAVSGHQSITLFNTQTLQVLGVLPFPEGQPEILQFSRTADLLMVGGGRGGANGKVVVFDVKTGERKIEVGDEYDTVLAADISADQTMVALGGPKRMVRVYSTETGELLFEKKKHTDWITALAFSPDGVLLASGDRSNGVVVWEAHTGQIFYELNGHRGAISDISWRPDSNVVATASEDGNIKLWDMNNGSEAKNWGAHGGGATAMDYTREGQLVSVGRDKIARLWNGDGAKVRDFGGLTDLGMEVAYDAESKRVLAGDWTGTVIVWNAEDGAEVGRLTTNPPTLAMRIDSLNQSLAAVAGEAETKLAQLAAMQQDWANKQAAAEKAKVEAAAMAEKAKVAAAAFAQAQQTAVAEQQVLAKSSEMLKLAQTQAQANAENLNKAAEALKAAEAALAQAKAAFEAAAKQKDGAQVALTEAQKAQTAATEAEAKSKEVYAVAQKGVTDAQAIEKAAMEAAAASQKAAEAAVAAAQPNEEQQKVLQQAQAEAEAAKQRLEQLKTQIEQLRAAQEQLATRDQ